MDTTSRLAITMAILIGQESVKGAKFVFSPYRYDFFKGFSVEEINNAISDLKKCYKAQGIQSLEEIDSRGNTLTFYF